MEPQKLTKFSDLFGLDLDGWKIAPCYYLELDHKLMGMFPAITGNEEIVVVLDKSLLQKVWKRLPRKPAKVTSLMVIVHQESGIAFNLEKENYDCADTDPLHVFSSEAIEALCQKEDSFRWTPGLILVFDKPVLDPIFV